MKHWEINLMSYERATSLQLHFTMFYNMWVNGSFKFFDKNPNSTYGNSSTWQAKLIISFKGLLYLPRGVLSNCLTMVKLSEAPEWVSSEATLNKLSNINKHRHIPAPVWDHWRVHWNTPSSWWKWLMRHHNQKPPSSFITDDLTASSLKPVFHVFSISHLNNTHFCGITYVWSAGWVTRLWKIKILNTQWFDA